MILQFRFKPVLKTIKHCMKAKQRLFLLSYGA
ncbi:hypothetical protein EUS_06740 [[Eubacterium] siraeum 70/3]|uniref:Uncharacterized protein n=1 Tax=[Eubacterium] siraeum 70/3 TaxID=657319 RepID=D4JS71_9FIRM|nr:hypothetical protein EUS_06740 [[Eubacterium] siraeum 70/3]